MTCCNCNTKTVPTKTYGHIHHGNQWLVVVQLQPGGLLLPGSQPGGLVVVQLQLGGLVVGLLTGRIGCWTTTTGPTGTSPA
ncbi:hypothetical protein CEXT_647251 [Caerostris extrusa]|uniref:Uncharacterized protein n=1 Tax=Caerostris extrusa TaxID=172846 RepID=A0AAV4QQQ8_CAEEX|nr:hypothetical protein CEXT_647251 [Caerostris extrusa]